MVKLFFKKMWFSTPFTIYDLFRKKCRNNYKMNTCGHYREGSIDILEIILNYEKNV